MTSTASRFYLNLAFSKACRQLIVAWLATAAVSHTQRTVCTIALKQAATVPFGNTETLSCEMSCQPPVNDVLDNFKPVNLDHREKLRTRTRHIKILSR